MLTVGCAQSISQGVEDAQLVARVKTALVNDPVLGPQPIEVQVHAGTVRLSGVVNSSADVDQALRLTRSVAGVGDVHSALRVGAVPGPPPAPDRYRARRTGGAALPDDTEPNLLGLGASIGTSQPTERSLDDGLSGGPIIALRPRSGFGPWIAFSWFRTNLLTGGEPSETFGTLRVRPVMAGVVRSFVRSRLSVGASLVGGLAFNSFSINDQLDSESRAVAVDNSLAWRAGIGLGYRLNRRMTLSGFAGYLGTRPTVTFVDPTGVFERSIKADTTQLSIGLVYWIF